MSADTSIEVLTFQILAGDEYLGECEIEFLYTDMSVLTDTNLISTEGVRIPLDVATMEMLIDEVL